ncbi:hypothetical protein QFC19_006753 [Naganishia cerealis]|uniref:Uncharacterized protein n=1 Tax=Naganishia cerealis TaxID=610337 RepID=A0ACC2VEC2_9TREE|nr:hypothetical protein QFC19_006753 [Naganishia cerealis]
MPTTPKVIKEAGSLDKLTVNERVVEHLKSIGKHVRSVLGYEFNSLSERNDQLSEINKNLQTRLNTTTSLLQEAHTLSSDLQWQIDTGKKSNREALQKAEEQITALQATRDHYKSIISKREEGDKKQRKDPDYLADVPYYETSIPAPPSRSTVVNDLNGQRSKDIPKMSAAAVVRKPRNIREGQSIQGIGFNLRLFIRLLARSFIASVTTVLKPEKRDVPIPSARDLAESSHILALETLPLLSLDKSML